MKTITVSGADVSLFHVAAAQYSDATAWLAIANANGLTDPQLSGPPVPLLIPDYDPSYSGSAPNQS